MNADSAREQLLAAISRKPRLHFGHLPTPLDDAPRLSDRLGVRVLLKRDDESGFALGGNKVRKLEFLIADVKASGADAVVTTGGSQSNHARIAAAACRRAELDCYLVLDRGVHPEQQGNLLLDELFGAHVRWLDTDDPTDAARGMDDMAAELRQTGRTPYVIPRGGSVPQGAIGYAAFVPELLEQVEQRGLRPTHLYLGTGSGGTHSGVLAGLTALGTDIELQGISVSRDRQQQTDKVVALTNTTLVYLGLEPQVSEEHVLVDDSYRGTGYGIPTEDTLEAIHMLALDEAVVLDPVYTGKAMAGLVGHARARKFGSNDTVIFLHTGGAPSVFAYHHEILAAAPVAR